MPRPVSPHFPMPVIANSIAPTFDGTLDSVRHQPHPAGIRCIRFRWNQGPSNEPEYPLDLNAGYQILELDTDAHTTKTFNDKEKLADALRKIQEIQMLPADDLLLSPGDTLTTSQWECWYASAMQRFKEPGARGVDGSEIARGPWYSWRESILEWPKWPGLTDAADSNVELEDIMHPFLQTIVSALDDDPDNKGQSTYAIDLQAGPPIQPGDLAAFLSATDPSPDPYGWGVLQRFGLAITISLRDEGSGELVTGEALLGAIKTVLDVYQTDSLFGGTYADFFKFLHVELLFQSGQSVSLENGMEPPEEAMLGLVQLSLRPITKQVLKYGEIQIHGNANEKIDLMLNLASPCTLIDQANPARGEINLQPSPDGKPVKLVVTLPLNGQTTLLLRSENDFPELGVELQNEPTDLTTIPTVSFEYRVVEDLMQLVIKPEFLNLTETEQKTQWDGLKDALDESDHGILDFDLLPARVFQATDENSTYFLAPKAALADAFSDSSNPNGGQQWRAFTRYAEFLTSQVEEGAKIEIPTSSADIESLLSDFIPWSQRFFDASGDVAVDDLSNLAQTSAGPWLATAYPRSASPAYASPDNSGRLKYDHLLEDKWAHNYRYYIRPFGRYDLLWQSLRQSASLFPNTEIELLELATPEPESAALDVVLDRTQPISRPVVLNSARLDEAGVPGKPARPGTIWEVIVAQHSEQALIERNQTLFRQLSYRQIAFTLLRRFSFVDWIDDLRTVSNWDGDYQLVENEFPAMSTTYPAQPDHIDLERISDGDARSLDLPLRLDNFQQGAMVLQWQALPFYYEHRLLLIAQTASNVSPVNDITQREFEYRSPTPEAFVRGLGCELGLTRTICACSIRADL